MKIDANTKFSDFSKEDDPDMKRAAEIAARDVLAVKEGDTALIITNPEPEVYAISLAVYDAIIALGGKPVIMVQPYKTQLDFAEPSVIGALNTCPDIAISLSAEKLGSPPDYKGWQGYEGVDLVAVVDLGKPVAVGKLSVGFLQNVDSWIFLPRWVQIEVSPDGKDFTLAARMETPVPVKKAGIFKHIVSRKFEDLKTRYIRVKAKSIETCPEWHPGAGGKAWIFADEIVVM